MQFTEKYIQSLKPTKDRYDIREKSGNGFAIRVSPINKKSETESKTYSRSWLFFYFFEGRKRRMTLGSYPAMSLSEARKKHREALKVLESGKDPALEKQRAEIEARDSYTLQELIEEYIDVWAKPNKRSWEADERLLNKDVKPLWGKRKAKEITRRDILHLLDKVKERGSPIQANRTLACVRRMFNFAVERDIVSANPCAQIKAPAKENRCDRVLSVSEIKALWIALSSYSSKSETYEIHMNPEARLALKLQLATAQRKGEIVSAEWSEIDLDTGWWTIPSSKAKNKMSHRVPLSKLALELLTEIKVLSGASRFLFPAKSKDTHLTAAAVDHALRRCTFKDIDSFSPHDLRRTAASHMTSMGISRLVVSKLLNHSENSVTAVYDRHSYDAEKKNALESWSTKLKEIITGNEKASNVVSIKEAS